jgi:hypothetical protein
VVREVIAGNLVSVTRFACGQPGFLGREANETNAQWYVNTVHEDFNVVIFLQQNMCYVLIGTVLNGTGRGLALRFG